MQRSVLAIPRDRKGIPVNKNEVCALCHEPATKTCGQCKARRYCGTVCQVRPGPFSFFRVHLFTNLRICFSFFNPQKSDWKLHKQYCTPPPNQTEFLKGLRGIFNGLGAEKNFTWEDVERRANGDATKMEGTLIDLMKDSLASRGVKPQKQACDISGWQGTLLASRAKWASLPVLKNKYKEDAQFCVTFAAFGSLDFESGEEIVSLTVMETTMDVIRYSKATRGFPTHAHFEEALFCAMVAPASHSGPPMRPALVLVAHRIGAEVFRSLRSVLVQCGVECILETAEEARQSAASAGTDPNGHNYSLRKPTA
jgi:hypothetical protein